MKTLHVTNAWSETSGGIATFYRALMEGANRREKQMVLVVPAASDGERNIGKHVRIYEIASPGARLNSVYRVIYPSQFLFAGGKLREILRREEPDLVEINDKYSLNYLGPLLRLGLIPEIKFRPVVVGLSCERMDVNFATYLRAGSLGRAFCKWYMRYVYFPFFDHHLVVSDETAQELIAASRGHEIVRGVFQLPMGVDCQTFSPSHRSPVERGRLLRRIGAPENSVLLLYVGRLAPEKNLPLLLETMEELSRTEGHCRLLIAGDGISREAFLADASKRLGQRVSWLGHIANREELAKLYANCDFFLHPNPREPFGIAPLEAMASGAVLVAPNSGGIQAYANETNAVLQEPTGRAFAQAVLGLVGDPLKRRQLMQAGLTTAQGLSWEAVTNRFFDFYAQLLACTQGRSSLASLSPKFLSSSPSPARKLAMNRASKLAAALYSFFSRAKRQSKNEVQENGIGTGGKIAGPLKV
jgi:alpha-1,6-mannosyltransferase